MSRLPTVTPALQVRKGRARGGRRDGDPRRRALRRRRRGRAGLGRVRTSIPRRPRSAPSFRPPPSRAPSRRRSCTASPGRRAPGGSSPPPATRSSASTARASASCRSPPSRPVSTWTASRPTSTTTSPSERTSSSSRRAYAPSVFPVIGDGDPRCYEHWFFAVWAYNGWVRDNTLSVPHLGAHRRRSRPLDRPRGDPLRRRRRS